MIHFEKLSSRNKPKRKRGKKKNYKIKKINAKENRRLKRLLKKYRNRHLNFADEKEK